MLTQIVPTLKRVAVSHFRRGDEAHGTPMTCAAGPRIAVTAAASCSLVARLVDHSAWQRPTALFVRSGRAGDDVPTLLPALAATQAGCTNGWTARSLRVVPTTESLASPLAAWANFYVITGSAGAALTGLMFVAIAVMTQVRRELSREGIGAFSTPTVVHLVAVILISAVLSVPWPDLRPLAVCLLAGALAGVVYVAVIIRRFRRSRPYRPDREDWAWHAAIPCISYLALGLAALFVASTANVALYLLGATILLLMVTGIHNAWDMVAYTSTVLTRDSTSASVDETNTHD